MPTCRNVTIVVRGNPVSVNHAWRHRGNSTYMDPAARRWKEQVAWNARMKYKGPPIRGPVSVTITGFFKDNRRRDIANVEKIAVDALEDICIVDDTQVEEEHLYKRIDPKDPRLEITVTELCKT